MNIQCRLDKVTHSNKFLSEMSLNNVFLFPKNLKYILFLKKIWRLFPVRCKIIIYKVTELFLINAILRIFYVTVTAKIYVRELLAWIFAVTTTKTVLGTPVS